MNETASVSGPEEARSDADPAAKSFSARVAPPPTRGPKHDDEPALANEPPTADEPTAEAGTGSEGAKPSKAPAIKDVRSIEGLLRYAYSRTGRFSIPPAVRDAIAAEDTPASDLQQLIGELVAEDELIKVPVRLLAAVDRAKGTLKFRRRCLGVTAIALLADPRLSAIPGLDMALAYPDQGEPSRVLRDVATALYTTATGGTDEEPAEAKEPNKRELVENGVTAFGLYFAIQREWKDTRLAHELESVLWADEYRAACGRKRESTKALLVEASPAALGTVSAAWRAAVEEAESHAASADRLRRAADEERAEADELRVAAEDEAERLRTLLTEHETTITELKAAIATEQQARHVQSSHAVDDYENLRTRVIRLLDRQLGLLEDGLHALRNGSTGVTEEYLERVIEAFVTQREALREANGPEGDAV